MSFASVFAIRKCVLSTPSSQPWGHSGPAAAAVVNDTSLSSRDLPGGRGQAAPSSSHSGLCSDAQGSGPTAGLLALVFGRLCKDIGHRKGRCDLGSQEDPDAWSFLQCPRHARTPRSSASRRFLLVLGSRIAAYAQRRQSQKSRRKSRCGCLAGLRRSPGRPWSRQCSSETSSQLCHLTCRAGLRLTVVPGISTPLLFHGGIELSLENSPLRDDQAEREVGHYTKGLQTPGRGLSSATGFRASDSDAARSSSGKDVCVLRFTNEVSPRQEG